jgi:UDP-glucose 4-epimerase
VTGSQRSGDLAVLIGDPMRARSVLGFEPVHSDLPTIIRTAWAWHRRAHPRRKTAAPAQ